VKGNETIIIAHKFKSTNNNCNSFKVDDHMEDNYQKLQLEMCPRWHKKQKKNNIFLLVNEE
jgi:hypothetical protein